MSDQNIPTDWAEHFANLRAQQLAQYGHELPSSVQDFTPMYSGEAKPYIIFMHDKLTGDLETTEVSVHLHPESTAGFDIARAIYEQEGGPEMWLFWNLQSAPWHCPARPKVKPQGRASLPKGRKPC